MHTTGHYCSNPEKLLPMNHIRRPKGYYNNNPPATFPSNCQEGSTADYLKPRYENFKYRNADANHSWNNQVSSYKDAQHAEALKMAAYVESADCQEGKFKGHGHQFQVDRQDGIDPITGDFHDPQKQHSDYVQMPLSVPDLNSPLRSDWGSKYQPTMLVTTQTNPERRDLIAQNMNGPNPIVAPETPPTEVDPYCHANNNIRYTFAADDKDVSHHSNYKTANLLDQGDSARQWRSPEAALKSIPKMSADRMDQRRYMNAGQAHPRDTIAPYIQGVPSHQQDPLFGEHTAGPHAGETESGHLIHIGKESDRFSRVVNAEDMSGGDVQNLVMDHTGLKEGSVRSHISMLKGAAKFIGLQNTTWAKKNKFQYEEVGGDKCSIDCTAVSSEAPEWFRKPNVTQTDKQYSAGIIFTRKKGEVGGERHFNTEPRGRRHQGIDRTPLHTEDVVAHRHPWHSQQDKANQDARAAEDDRQRLVGQETRLGAHGEPCGMPPRPLSAEIRTHPSFLKHDECSPMTHRPMMEGRGRPNGAGPVPCLEPPDGDELADSMQHRKRFENRRAGFDFFTGAHTTEHIPTAGFGGLRPTDTHQRRAQMGMR